MIKSYKLLISPILGEWRRGGGGRKHGKRWEMSGSGRRRRSREEVGEDVEDEEVGMEGSMERGRR